MCFRRAEHAIDPRFRMGNLFFFCVMYCPLFAAAHASIVRLWSLGAQALRFPSGPVGFWVQLASLLPWLAIVVLVLSHVQFRVGGKNPNWMQTVVGILSIAVLALTTLP